MYSTSDFEPDAFAVSGETKRFEIVICKHVTSTLPRESTKSVTTQFCWTGRWRNSGKRYGWGTQELPVPEIPVPSKIIKNQGNFLKRIARFAPVVIQRIHYFLSNTIIQFLQTLTFKNHSLIAPKLACAASTPSSG